MSLVCNCTWLLSLNMAFVSGRAMVMTMVIGMSIIVVILMHKDYWISPLEASRTLTSVTHFPVIW